MIQSRQRREGALRLEERRKREDAAPRLLAVVPRLQSLRLDLESHFPDEELESICHARHVVVQHAPALFHVPCGERTCPGEHDLTDIVLDALKAGETNFDGAQGCREVGDTGPCGAGVRYRVQASFEQSSAQPELGH